MFGIIRNHPAETLHRGWQLLSRHLIRLQIAFLAGEEISALSRFGVPEESPDIFQLSLDRKRVLYLPIGIEELLRCAIAQECVDEHDNAKRN